MSPDLPELAPAGLRNAMKLPAKRPGQREDEWNMQVELVHPSTRPLKLTFHCSPSYVSYFNPWSIAQLPLVYDAWTGRSRSTNPPMKRWYPQLGPVDSRLSWSA